MTKFTVEWHDHEREPVVKPNPEYPDGVDIIAVLPGAKGCTVKLPYPAKRCGVYRVECQTCGTIVATTTAGRPDDPRSIRIGCQKPSGRPRMERPSMPKDGLFA